MSNFAKRLRELRQAAGMTQAELAEKSGVPQGQLSHLENDRVPTWDTAMKLAGALGVSCEAFAKEEEGVDAPAPEAKKAKGKKGK